MPAAEKPPIAVHIEFFGIPRQRAGVAEMTIQVAASPTLGDVLAELARQSPPFAEACLDGAALRAGCIANFDGGQFVRSADQPLEDCRRVLILSADAGG